MYNHKKETHNLKSPKVIVPLLNDLIMPKSVVDIGCGVGTFLFTFKQAGVKEVMGIDGEWVNKDLLKNYLEAEEFWVRDLSKYILLKKYDLAICLEVAEHIEEADSDNLVKTLVNTSDVIVFSAAVPSQRGQHHKNEQWPTYWKTKFLKYQFIFHDILRPLLWNNPDVDYWYKQNIFLVTHRDYVFTKKAIQNISVNAFDNIIHPDAFIKRSILYENIINGNMSAGFYGKLFIKKILIKLKFHSGKNYSN